MLRVRVLMSPRIPWMQVFEDFKEVLRDAIFQVIGDVVPKGKIYIESEYGKDFFSKVVVRMYWGYSWTPAPSLRENITDDTIFQASEFARKNFPNSATEIKIHTLCQE